MIITDIAILVSNKARLGSTTTYVGKAEFLFDVFVKKNYRFTSEFILIAAFAEFGLAFRMRIFIINST